MFHKMVKNFHIKFLTFFLAFFVFAEIFAASIVRQENKDTHLRLEIFTEKENIVLSKEGNQVVIKTLNSEFFEDAQRSFSNLNVNSSYVRDINFLPPGDENNISQIIIELNDRNVEFFSFYKQREKMYIFDFWKEEENIQKLSDSPAVKRTARKTPKKQPKAKTNSSSNKVKSRVPADINPKEVPGLLTKKSREKSAPSLKDRNKPEKDISNDGYQDFRYGASFIWDYEGFGPEMPQTIDIITKTPEYFYPIENRDLSKGEEEAHLQLSINLYRKKKYGLMYKSIQLFNEKYPDSKISHINEYLKVNAIIRNHIAEGNREPLKMSINMLRSLAEASPEYDLTKAIIKYLISYYVGNKEYVEVLKQAKRFYVISKENYDYEESTYAAEAIFYSLSMMNQVDRVEEVLKEKTIAKLLPRQLQLAYRIFVSHKFGDMDKVVRHYEDYKESLVGKVYPSILFNVGEAYFRTGKMEKAIGMFDRFLAHYSYHGKSDFARLRLALIYEIMDKNKKQTKLLYKNAINRSTKKDVLQEAKFRLTALRSVRKVNPDKEDMETRIFLNIDPKIDLPDNLKKLLWIVRLRTFIRDKKYADALRYLRAIPLTSLKPAERRVFEADGSEIIYGIIHDHYVKGEYSNIVKVWNMYKDKYVVKVANDPFINFVVGQSYLKLGLYQGFEKQYVRFKKLNEQPVKTFPHWVDRVELGNKTAILKELSVIKNIRLENWELASRDLNDLKKADVSSDRYSYYMGIIYFQRKDYRNSMKQFENFLSSQKRDMELDPNDLANLIRYYTDSIYELGLTDKYQDVSKAILEDTEKFSSDNPFLKDTLERLEYMNIEILAGKADEKAYLMVENKINKFLQKYKEPKNYGRIKYLLGHSYVKNMKLDKGKEVLEQLLEDEKISEYIKELAKSELSMIAIKKRTL